MAGEITARHVATVDTAHSPPFTAALDRQTLVAVICLMLFTNSLSINDGLDNELSWHTHDNCEVCDN